MPKTTSKKATTKKTSKKLVVKEEKITDPALLTKEKVNLIKRTVAKGATDDELKMFLIVATRAGLDPFTKQIHFVKRNVKQRDGSYVEIGTVQTGIDGYRSIAERSGKYGGSEDATFTFAKENDKTPASATVKVLKLMGDKIIEIKATAFWEEFFPSNEKLAFMWKKMPKLMLAKCAEALALRKAFPNVLSGIYTHEEMDQAEPSVKETKTDESKKVLASSKAYIFQAKTPEELEKLEERINKAKDIDVKTKTKLKEFCDEKRKEFENNVEEAEIV